MGGTKRVTTALFAATGGLCYCVSTRDAARCTTSIALTCRKYQQDHGSVLHTFVLSVRLNSHSTPPSVAHTAQRVSVQITHLRSSQICLKNTTTAFVHHVSMTRTPGKKQR